MAQRVRNITLNWLDWVCLILVIIGALNWGLVGFLGFDLIGTIFGGTFSTGARVIFAIVGLAGLWSIYTFWKILTKFTGTMAEREEERMRPAA